jgi:hypothetical protein
MFSGVPWYEMLDVQHLLQQGFLDVLCTHLPTATLGYMQDGAQNVAYEVTGSREDSLVETEGVYSSACFRHTIPAVIFDTAS